MSVVSRLKCWLPERAIHPHTAGLAVLKHSHTAGDGFTAGTQTMFNSLIDNPTAILPTTATITSRINNRVRLSDHLPVNRARDFRATLTERFTPDDTGGSGTRERDNRIQREAYAEDTPLTWVFGDHPEAKLVATFLSEPQSTLDVSDLRRLSGVDDDAAVERTLAQLERHDMIACDRSDGETVACTVNDNSPSIEQLRQTEQVLLSEWHNN